MTVTSITAPAAPGAVPGERKPADRVGAGKGPTVYKTPQCLKTLLVGSNAVIYINVGNKIIINTDNFKAFGQITQIIPEKIDEAVGKNEKAERGKQNQ